MAKYTDRKQVQTASTGNQGGGLNAKGPQETFWRDGNCLSCDCGGGYTIVYIC